MTDADSGVSASKQKMLAEMARRRGALADGSHRVLIDDPELGWSHRDFESLDEARAYADDVASESSFPPLLAYVFDDRFSFIERGCHYAERATKK